MLPRLLKEIKLLVMFFGFFSECPIFLDLGIPKSSMKILTRPKVIYDFLIPKVPVLLAGIKVIHSPSESE